MSKPKLSIIESLPSESYNYLIEENRGSYIHFKAVCDYLYNNTFWTWKPQGLRGMSPIVEVDGNQDIQAKSSIEQPREEEEFIVFKEWWSTNDKPFNIKVKLDNQELILKRSNSLDITLFSHKTHLIESNGFSFLIAGDPNLNTYKIGIPDEMIDHYL